MHGPLKAPCLLPLNFQLTLAYEVGTVRRIYRHIASRILGNETKINNLENKFILHSTR